MADGVRMTITGDDAALAEFGRLAERAEHAQPMYARIGESLFTSTRRRFETSTGPDGSPWPPSLRVLAHGGKTLIETQRMFQSLAFNAWDTGVEIGTNVPYAAIHQLGGTIEVKPHTQVLHFKQHARTGKMLPGFRKAKNATLAMKAEVGAHTIKMPARPFLGLDDDDAREVVLIAESWLRGAEARA